jgi:hypothetical protein
MLIDTAAIWYRLQALHYYDREEAPATPLSERLRLEPLMLRGRGGPGSLPLRGPKSCTCRPEGGSTFLHLASTRPAHRLRRPGASSGSG